MGEVMQNKKKLIIINKFAIIAKNRVNEVIIRDETFM